MLLKLNDWMIAWMLLSVIIFLGILHGFTCLFRSRLYGAIACGCFYLLLTTWFWLMIFLDDRKYYRQKAEMERGELPGDGRSTRTRNGGFA